MEKAIDAAMKTAKKVTFTGKTYRRDIGQDLLKLKKWLTQENKQKAPQG